jgi:hypothetical protein
MVKLRANEPELLVQPLVLITQTDNQYIRTTAFADT